jgi:hypothetical protein
MEGRRHDRGGQVDQVRLAFVACGRRLLEDLQEALGSFVRVETHHADGGGVVEDHRQQRAVSHQGKLDVVRLALMEQDGELVLSEQARHLLRRGERARDEGRDGVHVEGPGHTLLGDQVSLLVHEEGAPRARELEELLQDPVDDSDVIPVEDQAPFSKGPVVAILVLGHPRALFFRKR